MNLYKISQTENDGYDTYDSAVVVADTEESARNMNPRGEWIKDYNAWASNPSKVKVELIGKALDTLEYGTFICKSFNAG